MFGIGIRVYKYLTKVNYYFNPVPEVTRDIRQTTGIRMPVAN
jgi:hypothetical protein